MQYVSALSVTGFLLLCIGFAPIQSVCADDKAILAGEVVSVSGLVFVRPDGRESSGALTPAKPGDPVHSNDIVNTSSNGSVKILMKDKTIMDVGASALFKVDHYQQNKGPDRQADVSLMYGTLRGAVTQKIEGKARLHLRTPTATMGVRGTEFVVSTGLDDFNGGKGDKGDKGGKGDGDKAENHHHHEDGSKTQITVIQGKVDVSQKTQDLSVPPTERSIASVTSGSPITGQTLSLTAGQQVTTNIASNSAPSQPITLDTTSLTKLTTAATVADNTFTKAVVIDPTTGGSSSSGSNSGSGGNSHSGGGESVSGGQTISEITASIHASVPTAPTTSIGDLSIPGTFGAANANAPSVVPHGGLHTVTIIIKGGTAAP